MFLVVDSDDTDDILVLSLYLSEIEIFGNVFEMSIKMSQMFSLYS